MKINESDKVWRCMHCGVRVSTPLTDDKFGSCNCEDHVYDPEFSLMTVFIADCLDWLERENAELKATIKALKQEMHDKYIPLASACRNCLSDAETSFEQVLLAKKQLKQLKRENAEFLELLRQASRSDEE